MLLRLRPTINPGHEVVDYTVQRIAIMCHFADRGAERAKQWLEDYAEREVLGGEVLGDEVTECDIFGCPCDQGGPCVMEHGYPEPSDEVAELRGVDCQCAICLGGSN